MKKDDTVFLRHIRDAIQSVAGYVEGVTYDQFLRRRMIQDAVVRQLEIIGEASNNLSAGLREAHPEVTWEQIIGMRNRLIHAYFQIDLAIVWEVVQVDLPVLKAQVVHMLDELGWER